MASHILGIMPKAAVERNLISYNSNLEFFVLRSVDVLGRFSDGFDAAFCDAYWLMFWFFGVLYLPKQLLESANLLQKANRDHEPSSKPL